METGVTKVIEEAGQHHRTASKSCGSIHQGGPLLAGGPVRAREAARHRRQDVRDKVAGVLGASSRSGTDPARDREVDVDAVPSCRSRLRQTEPPRSHRARPQAVKEDIETPRGRAGDPARRPGARHQRLRRSGPADGAGPVDRGRCAPPSSSRTSSCPAAASTRRAASSGARPGADRARPDFNELIVAHVGDRPLRVRDLGYAEDGGGRSRARRALERRERGPARRPQSSRVPTRSR